MYKIKIILVDDHEIFLAGLKLKLELFQNEIEVAGEACSFEELVPLFKKCIPDLILLDFNLPGKNGIEIAEFLSENSEFKKIKTIILSAFTSRTLSLKNYELICEAIDVGINGYLLKDSKTSHIVEAIRNVMAGDTFILGKTINLQEVNKELIKDRKRLALILKRQKNFGLTNREVEILKYLSEGYSSKQIGFLLKISEDSITNHKDNIRLKLKEKYNITLKNVVEMIVWAIKNKVIQS